MRLPSHLRLSRHGIWYFRIVLPDNLAALLGQKEIRRTLGTRCPEAAKHAAYRLSGRILPFIRRAREAMEFDPRSIDRSKIRELVAKGFKIDVNAGTIEAEHFETNPDPEIAKHEMEALSLLAKQMRQSPEVMEHLAKEAELAAMIESQPARPKCENPTSIGAAVKKFMETKGRLALGSKRTYQTYYDQMTKLLGGEAKMLHELSTVDCINAWERYTSTPANASKRGKDVKGPALSSTTIKEAKRRWASFFQWAIQTKRYNGANPITDLPKPAKGNHEGKGAEPFSPDELRRIFQWQNFKDMKKPHQFWGPLIALFTGCRSNEIAQLRTKDIVIEDGLKCISMVHEPEDPYPTFLKTPAAARKLVIHPTLWAIGFQDYLDDLKSIEAKRLFPNLPPDPETKKMERYLSRDFNEGLLQDLGIWRTRVKVFHSFRDNMNSRLASCKLHPAHIADWMGHAREGTEGERYIERLTVSKQAADFLPIIDFGIDFSEFRYEKNRWNEWLKNHMVP